MFSKILFVGRFDFEIFHKMESYSESLESWEYETTFRTQNSIVL